MKTSEGGRLGSDEKGKMKLHRFLTKLPECKPLHISFVGTDRSQTSSSPDNHAHELELLWLPN